MDAVGDGCGYVDAVTSIMKPMHELMTSCLGLLDGVAG